MRKRLTWFIYIFTILLLLFLQTSFFPQFLMFKPVKPDLILLFIMTIGLIKGFRGGAIAGAVAGFISGVISWNIWGFYILAYCAAGLAGGLILEKVEPDYIIVPFLSGASVSGAVSIIFILMGNLFGIYSIGYPDIYRIFNFVLIQALFSIPVFWFSKTFLIAPGVKLDLEAIGIKSDYIIQ